MKHTNLAGKVALITGGATGIGFGATQRLIEEGAFVYITGRRVDVLDRAVSRLGGNVRAITADVTKKADMVRVAETIRAGHGRLDIVFANAGAGRPVALADLTEEQIDHELNVNVKGVIFTVQAMLDILTDGGSIVINASITADMGLPGFAVYAAAKAGAISLARSWTTDLKSRGIRVNTLSPGVVPTEAYSGEMNMSEDQIAAYVERVAEEIPAGRVGTVRDVADALVFLVSDASSYVRGIDLVVDGGMTRVYAGKN